MKFVSCRGVAGKDGSVTKYTFEEALMAGYAPDGGMFLPERVPKISKATLRSWASLSYSQLCATIMGLFIGSSEIDSATMQRLVNAATSRFDKPEDTVPVVRLPALSSATGRGVHVAELHHGPTLAFKDLGLSVLGRLMDYFLTHRRRHATVLVGTSGDTGSSAIHGVLGCPAIDIVVMYPGGGRISKVQERQMTTVDDPQVHVLQVDGTSDDLDVVIKRVFDDVTFCRKYNVTSANSVNICRILVQIVHYFYAYLKLVPDSSRSIDFSVPSGAGGHITAGVLARLMGLPAASMQVAVVRDNDIFAGLVSHSRFERSEKVVVTLAPSMDIQVPYNVERLFYMLTDGDTGTVRAWMDKFMATGSLTLPPPYTPQLWASKLGLVGSSVTQDSIKAAMRAAWHKDKYFLCPHSAVGVAAVLADAGHTETQVVCMATAHASKFAEAVEAALGVADFDALVAAGGPAATKMAACLTAPTKSTFLPRCGGAATAGGGGSGGAGGGAGAGAEAAGWEDAWTAALRQCIVSIDERRKRQPLVSKL